MPAFVRTSGMIYMVLNSYMFYGQNGGVLKKILRRIGILLAVLLVVCIGYVIYVMVAYYRLPDNQPLSIVNYDDDRRRPVADSRLMAWGELTSP